MESLQDETFSFSSIIAITFWVFIVVLILALQRHEPEPPLLPTNQRPYSGYTEPRSYHSPVETPSPTSRVIPSSTPRSESLAGPEAFTTRPQYFPSSRPHPPPPPPSSVRKPQQYSFSRDNFPGTSTKQVHQPVTKATVQRIVEPALNSTYQPPPPEPIFGARKPQQYSFSGNDLPGPLIKPVHEPTTKAYIQKTVKPALDSVYQPPSLEPSFGARKPQQYSFSGNNLPRTLVEPIHRPATKTPVQKTPPSPEPLFGARKPQQYSFSRDDLSRTSINQIHGPATKALDQKAVDPSFDSIYLSPPPEPSFGARKSQQYSFSRNDLPSPLVENINQLPVKTPVQKTGERCYKSQQSQFFESRDKGTVIDKGGDDDDIKDLDHLALRKLANQEMDNMKKCRTEEKLARRYRQLILARELKVKARQHEKRMQELNDRASEVVFAKNNKDPTLRRIDLHGLTVKEAIDHTNRILKQARELGNSEIRIIVGKGIHSKDGLAKLKPAIRTYLEEHKFPVEVDPRNDGAFLVRLDSTRGS